MTDGAGAGDQHVLAHQIEHQSRVGGVAEGVKEGHHVLGQGLVDDDDVGGGDADVLGKGAVPVHAHGDRVLAPLDVAGVAVAAVVAGDVALAGDPLAHVQAGDALAQLGDLAHVLMADGHGRVLDVLGGPGVPVVDVNVGAADGGLVDLDQNLARLGFGDGDAAQLQAGAGNGLYDGIHEGLHKESPFDLLWGRVSLLF